MFTHHFLFAGYSILLLAWKEFSADPILEGYYKRHPELVPKAWTKIEKDDDDL